MPQTGKGVDLSNTTWQRVIKPNGKVPSAWRRKKSHQIQDFGLIKNSSAKHTSFLKMKDYGSVSTQIPFIIVHIYP